MNSRQRHLVLRSRLLPVHCMIWGGETKSSPLWCLVSFLEGCANDDGHQLGLDMALQLQINRHCICTLVLLYLAFVSYFLYIMFVTYYVLYTSSFRSFCLSI